MNSRLAIFEEVVRRAGAVSGGRSDPTGGLHPFEERNIHPRIAHIARDLFDDGHYSQATFEAYKFLDKEVQRHSRCTETGFKLMMKAFATKSPLLRLTALSNDSEKDEQKGVQFIFAGSVLAIRNPRGHEVALPDSPDKCLDHLGLASLLLRRLGEAGFQ